MFGMGWQEILIILVIGVLVIGPEQLPQVARTIGKMMAQFRRATNDLRETINREFTEKEEFKDFQEFTHTLDSEVRGIGYTAQEYVEREVAKEEQELKQIEQEVKTAGDDLPEQVSTATWTPKPGDFPDDEPRPGTEEPAAQEEDDAPAGQGGPRKESA